VSCGVNRRCENGVSLFHGTSFPCFTAGRDWTYFGPLVLVVVVLAPFVFAHAPARRTLEMGDDAAAATGPIPFVALAAPQLARRLTRRPGPNLAASAAMGAALVVAADYLGQRILSSSLFPVGVVAAALGGAYLIWLLVASRRRVA
jgi:iron complex transport system permease protein